MIIFPEPFATSQQRVYPRNQNRQLEWLWKVIVGPRFKTAKNILSLSARRQHQDGYKLTLCPQVGSQSKPVHSRQHYVEDHHIVFARSLLQQFQRSLSVANCVDAIPLGFEVVTQSICEVLFVFDDQNPTHN
jgi:hypothetical protein